LVKPGKGARHVLVPIIKLVALPLKTQLRLGKQAKVQFVSIIVEESIDYFDEEIFFCVFGKLP
jgi:hypothetical protein